MAKRILLAPLDWGFGHATRCIPIALELQRQGAEVVLGGTFESRKRILQSVPGLEEFDLPGYGVSYSRYWPAWMMVILQSRKIYRAVSHEQEALRAGRFDGIISDNRYGLYRQDIPSVIISHQLYPFVPLFLKPFQKMVYHRLNAWLARFDEVWLPDVAPGEGNYSFGTLSGSLSEPLPEKLKVRHTGILSRFEYHDSQADDKIFDLAVVVSGPSPQREAFIRQAVKMVTKNKLCAVWLLPDNSGFELIPETNQTLVLSSEDELFEQSIRQSACILSRSGYSSLSDWLKLKRSAILVPTPGQTEQEYLARHINNHYGFQWVSQDKLSRLRMEAFRQTTPKLPDYENTRLKQCIADFLVRC